MSHLITTESHANHMFKTCEIKYVKVEHVQNHMWKFLTFFFTCDKACRQETTHVKSWGIFVRVKLLLRPGSGTKLFFDDIFMREFLWNLWETEELKKNQVRETKETFFWHTEALQKNQGREGNAYVNSTYFHMWKDQIRLKAKQEQTKCRPTLWGTLPPEDNHCDDRNQNDHDSHNTNNYVSHLIIVRLSWITKKTIHEIYIL